MCGREVGGIACDVGSAKDVDALADYAVQKFGKIDVWVISVVCLADCKINNAGTTGYQRNPLTDMEPQAIQDIVNTNLLGSIYGTWVCKTLLTKQDAERR